VTEADIESIVVSFLDLMPSLPSLYFLPFLKQLHTPYYALKWNCKHLKCFRSVGLAIAVTLSLILKFHRHPTGFFLYFYLLKA